MSDVRLTYLLSDEERSRKYEHLESRLAGIATSRFILPIFVAYQKNKKKVYFGYSMFHLHRMSKGPFEYENFELEHVS